MWLLQAFWRSYGPLIISVAEALFEFAGLILILRGSRALLLWLTPEWSCNTFIDCVHNGAFLVVWGALVAVFVFYAVLFAIQRFRARARQLLAQPIEQRLQAVESNVVYSRALVGALASMTQTATFSDRSRAVAELQMAKELLGERGLLDRRISLFTGRLYRQMGRLDKAIEALTTFILEKEQRGQLDVDLADAYYNRACYHVLKMAGTADLQAEREFAYSDLATSIRYHEGNRLDACSDEDFASIRDEPRFRQLCGLG